jgi:pilus assembly protein Flp/PilA
LATSEVRSVKKLLEFLRDEEGASAVEYGIMVAAIAAVIITVTILIGDQLKAAFQKVANALGALGTPG